MPRPFFARLLCLAVVAAFGAGCDNSSTTVPPPPTPDPITEPPFTGTLQANGAQTYTFAVTDTGTVTATLASLDPDPDGATVVSLGLGAWDGTACQINLANDAAHAGAVLTASATTTGLACARIADGTGSLTAPVAFVVNIVHF
jgi:hypothetical protein